MIYAIGRVAPILFGITLLIQPIISATYGWLVYGEKLAGLDWIGAGLIALALVLVRGRD
jgi:drug/metabolite transporter (DMT)-like permease